MLPNSDCWLFLFLAEDGKLILILYILRISVRLDCKNSGIGTYYTNHEKGDVQLSLWSSQWSGVELNWCNMNAS